MESFELDGIGEIKVRRSANIKYLSIRMSPGRGVWVNVPYGVSGRQMIRFVEEKKEWIARNLPKVKSYEKSTGVGLGHWSGNPDPVALVGHYGRGLPCTLLYD